MLKKEYLIIKFIKNVLRNKKEKKNIDDRKIIKGRNNDNLFKNIEYLMLLCII